MKRWRPISFVFAFSMWTLAGTLSDVVANERSGQSNEKLAEIHTAFANAFDTENHEQMVKIGLQLLEKTPNDSHLKFLLAQAYVNLDDHSNAIKWLKACAEGGYCNIGPSKKWKAFDGLKSDPAYEPALALIRENRAKAWESFKRTVTASEPLIVLPPGHDGETATPLLVAVHRQGETPEVAIELFRSVAARMGAVLVAPRGPEKQSSGGWNWGDTNGWRYQRESVHKAVTIVLDAAERVVQKHPIDQERFFVAGFSQGADVALWAVQHQAFLIRGVLAIAPHDHTLFERYRGSVRPVAPKFYLLVGSDDARLAEVLQIEDQIRGANMPVKVRVIDGLGHELPKDPNEEFMLALNYMLGLDEG